jgi:hypothetical protein
VLLLGCLGGSRASWSSRDGLLWDEAGRVGVPDLAAQGWERTRIDESDLAFLRPGADVIAMRLRCGQAEPSTPLRWQSRGLWLGIPRSDFQSREILWKGRKAFEMTAESDGLAVRTLLIEASSSCRLELAHVAQVGADTATADFERFLAAVQLGPAQ